MLKHEYIFFGKIHIIYISLSLEIAIYKLIINNETRQFSHKMYIQVIF